MISIKVKDRKAHTVADGTPRDILVELCAGVSDMMFEMSKNKDEFNRIKNIFIIAIQSLNYEDCDDHN